VITLPVFFKLKAYAGMVEIQRGGPKVSNGVHLILQKRRRPPRQDAEKMPPRWGGSEKLGRTLVL